MTQIDQSDHRIFEPLPAIQRRKGLSWITGGRKGLLEILKTLPWRYFDCGSQKSHYRE